MLRLDHELGLEFKERLGFLMAIGDRGHYAQIGQIVNQNATYLARISSDEALWHFAEVAAMATRSKADGENLWNT